MAHRNTYGARAAARVPVRIGTTDNVSPTAFPHVLLSPPRLMNTIFSSQVIPLSSLANIGPAELYRQGAPNSRHNLLSWLSIPSSLRRANEDAPVGYGKIQKDKDLDGVDKGTAGLVEAVPVLALSYWVEGEPR